ncbi:MAG: flagellar hook-length control protein FliK [Planctomycetes bacterium]|nr:flagellar hook-length control protein FliK [Planctomycetota bacterium]
MESLPIKPQVEVPEPKSSRDGVSGRYARSRTHAASEQAQRSHGAGREAEPGAGEPSQSRRSEGVRRTHRSRRQRAQGRGRAEGQRAEGGDFTTARPGKSGGSEAGASFASSLKAKASAAAQPAEQGSITGQAEQTVRQEPSQLQAPQLTTSKLQAPTQQAHVARAGKVTAASARTPEAAPIAGPKEQAAAGKARTEAKAPAEAAPTPERDQASDVLRQVRLQIIPEARTATVYLKPAELGRVSIKLVVEGDEVRAVVRAETPEALAALEQHMPELEASLEDRGFADAQLDLALGFEGEPTEQADGADAVEPSPDQIHRLFANAEGVDYYA